MQFATYVQGNLSASLDITGFTGEQEDVEDNEEIIYSDNPLATGLSRGLNDGRTSWEGDGSRNRETAR